MLGGPPIPFPLVLGSQPARPQSEAHLEQGLISRIPWASASAWLSSMRGSSSPLDAAWSVSEHLPGRARILSSSPGTFHSAWLLALPS